MKRRSGVLKSLVAGGVTLWITTAAPAAKLDQAACDALKAEQAQLTSTGVKADMQRGPDWAKANLAPERLQQIQRFIAVDEQLAYRCADLKLPKPANAAPAPRAGKKGRANAKAPEGATGQTATEPPAPSEASTPNAVAGKLGPTPQAKSGARRTNTRRKASAGASGNATAPLSP